MAANGGKFAQLMSSVGQQAIAQREQDEDDGGVRMDDLRRAGMMMTSARCAVCVDTPRRCAPPLFIEGTQSR